MPDQRDSHVFGYSPFTIHVRNPLSTSDIEHCDFKQLQLFTHSVHTLFIDLIEQRGELKIISTRAVKYRERRSVLSCDAQTLAGDLTPGSRVQSCGGSDTPAPPTGTKYVLDHEASVGCEVEAGRGPYDELMNTVRAYKRIFAVLD